MKIYIHTDLEGISGVDSIEMINRDDPRHMFARERLMADTNAAIAGAFDGGATEVWVADKHGGANSFIHELLDKRAKVDPPIRGRRWTGGLDETFDATMIIGAHAMAGTLNAFLDHTQSSLSCFNYYVNGRKMGEMAQWAIMCAHFGVPLIMVSGDEAACAEARAFFNPIETAAVKVASGRNKAISYDLKEAEKRIREAAARAISLIGKAKPFKPILPMEIIEEYTRADYCDAAYERTGAERLDARTLRKISNSYLDIFIW